MHDYIQRLVRCGFPADEAYQTVYSMLKEFGTTGLEDFIKGIEEDSHGMDRI
jgi:hypothetical protein